MQAHEIHLSDQNGSPVAHAVVHAKELNRHYISNEKGVVKLETKAKNKKLSLAISSLRIRDTTISCIFFPEVSCTKIVLQEEIYTMPEFQYEMKLKRLQRRAGYRRLVAPGSIVFGENDSIAGLEFITLIENTRPIMLEEMALNIRFFRSDTFYVGFNIRKLDTTGTPAPGKKVLPTDILLPVVDRGRVVADLSDHNLVIGGKYFLSFTVLSPSYMIERNLKVRKGRIMMDNIEIGALPAFGNSKTWFRYPGNETWEHDEFMNPMISCRYREVLID